jgi:hypothetical protein
MKGVKLVVTIITFDGVDLVSYTDSLLFEKSLSKTIENFVADFAEGDFVSKLLGVEEVRSELVISYYVVVDYEDIFDHVAEKFKAFDVKSDSDLINELRSDIEDFNPLILRMLLGNLFTIDDLHYLFELVSGKKVDKGNFHKMIKRKDWLTPTTKFLNKVKHRPPRLYTIKISSK